MNPVLMNKIAQIKRIIMVNLKINQKDLPQSLIKRIYLKSENMTLTEISFENLFLNF